MDYKGYTDIKMNVEDMSQFCYNPNSVLDKYSLYENEFLVIRDEDGQVAYKYKYQNGVLEPVRFTTVGDYATNVIKPRNVQQELAFNMLKDDRTSIKLITGGFGSGKTLALCAAAIEAINKGKFSKIVWVRNNIQVKDTDQIGALPGDSFDKLLPYVMPLADHTGGIDGIRNLLETGALEVIPLGFLRGRSIRNSVIISSEAENLTKEHIQLIIGRVDEGSQLWMDADLKQRDKIVFEKSAGIETLISRLKGQPLFGYVHLIKTERSKTAQLADLLD